MKSTLSKLALSLTLAALILLTAAAPTLHAAARSADRTGSLITGWPLLYQFTGVSDDGAKGVNGKVATTLNCTNTGTTTAHLDYYVYNFNSSTSFKALWITLIAGQTYTISTQSTALFTDDKVLNTIAIDQGIGKVFSDSGYLICSAVVLDPTGYPPAFVTSLRMYTAFGYFADQQQSVFLPMIKR